MRNRIFGAIGVIWGGGVLLRAILRGGITGTGGYAAGQMIALFIAAILLIVGVYYLVTGGGAKKPQRFVRQGIAPDRRFERYVSAQHRG